jgi:hypothetical protein
LLFPDIKTNLAKSFSIGYICSPFYPHNIVKLNPGFSWSGTSSYEWRFDKASGNSPIAISTNSTACSWVCEVMLDIPKASSARIITAQVCSLSRRDSSQGFSGPLRSFFCSNIACRDSQEIYGAMIPTY